jgi:Fe2+ or Zn2+ uptake regulation protein
MSNRDQIQYLVAKNSASSLNDLEQNEELPAHPPAHLNRNQKAVVRFILRQLKRDSEQTFSSSTIAETVELSVKTVQRTLKLLQREGYLRLHKLKTGFVRYTYHKSPLGHSMTVYDAVESLLVCFPDEAMVKPELAPISYRPFTKADAIGIASFHGISKADAEELWQEYRTQQAGLETDQNWTRFLNENQELLGLVAA